MVDGTMRDDHDLHADQPEDGPQGDDTTDAVLDAGREELERAADDLERLTSELRERTRLVARLEVLSDALLDRLADPVIVVDDEGRISAVSRGASTQSPGLADALGKPASSVLPPALVDELAAFVAGADATPSQSELLADTSTSFLALPDGSVLVAPTRLPGGVPARQVGSGRSGAREMK